VEARPEALRQMREALARDCPPDRLRVAALERFHGPNIHVPAPAFVCRLEAGAAATDAVRQRLEAAFPDFAAERPSGKKRAKGTGDTPALLAVQLTRRILAKMLHFELRCGAAEGDAGSSLGWIEYLHPGPVLQALGSATVAVGIALGEADLPIGTFRRYFAMIEQTCRRYGPHFDSLVLIEAARKRDIPYLQIADNHVLWQFGWGSRSNIFWVTSSNADGLAGHRISGEKDVAKRLFRQIGVPTPASRTVRADGDYRAAAREIGWPCVVKPLRGGGGAGVSADIRDEQTLVRAVTQARKSADMILIEAHEPGHDHRLMVIDGRLVAAVRRDRPSVTGDGSSSVADLIAALNAGRQGPMRERRFLVPIADDEMLALTLAGQGLDMQSVPAKGRTVLLRTNANRGTGGTCADVSAQVHPQVRQLAEHITAAFGYRATGLDYVTPDISRSHDEVGGGFLEANSTPGIDVLISAGMSEDEIGGLVLGTLPGRIPVVLIVIPAEQQEKATRALWQELTPTDAAAGCEWARIGTLELPETGLEPPARVAALLRYPTVERLFILWSAEDIARFGLPVDALDTTVISGPAPAAEWLALIERQSKQVISAVSPAKAVQASIGRRKRS